MNTALMCIQTTYLRTGQEKDEQEQNTFYLSGIMNKILTARSERNCANIV